MGRYKWGNKSPDMGYTYGGRRRDGGMDEWMNGWMDAWTDG